MFLELFGALLILIAIFNQNLEEEASFVTGLLGAVMVGIGAMIVYGKF